MASELQISKEAAARRYVELHDENLAAVYSRGGRVIYYAKPIEFPALALRKDVQLPVDVKVAPGKISDLDAVAARDLLRKPAGVELFAQTLGQQNGHAITLLHAETSDDHDVDDTCERFQRR